MVVGNHLLLYTVDDERSTVWILHLRHGHRRPAVLPDRAPDGEGEDGPG